MRAVGPTLLLLIISCHGAPVPDGGTQLLSGLDMMLSTLGTSRLRREVGYDKELTIEQYGISVGLSYHDPNDKRRGGKAYLNTPKANFVMDLSNGVRSGDGPFSIDIDYTIHENGATGKFKIERSKEDDGQFRTKINNLPSDTDFLPLVRLVFQSDYKTMANMALSYTNKGHNGDLKVKFVRGEDNVDMEAEYNGKRYQVKGSFNEEEKTGSLLIVTPERDYTLSGNVVEEGDVKILVEGNMMGPMSFVMIIKEDYREAKLELTHNKAKMLQMKLRGEKVDDKIDVEAKWALLGGKLAKGRMDAKLVEGSATVVVTPNGGKPVTVSAFYPSSAGDTNTFGFSGTKGDRELFRLEGELERKDSNQIYLLGIKTSLSVSEKSLMYSSGCRIGALTGEGCFKSRDMELKVVIDKNDQRRISVYMKNVKDGVTRLEFTVNTRNSPYKVDIASPALTEYIGSDRMFLVLGVKPFTELTLETSYENLKLEVLHDKNSAGRKMSVEMMRGGVKEVNYKLDVDYDQTDAALNIHSKSNFDVSEDSFLHPLFCSYGCFKNRVSEVDIFIDHKNKNHLLPKFRVSIRMLKDQKEAFSLLADTRDSPYKFEMSAPQILPDLIEVAAINADITHTVDSRSYQFAPTSHVQISTNVPKFQTIDIKSSDSGIFVRREGNLIMKVFNFIGGKSSNSLEADVEFGQLKKVRLSMSWETDKVLFTLDGGQIMKISGNIKRGDGKLDFDIGGFGPKVGKFSVDRSIEWSTGKLVMKGKAETEKGWLNEWGLSPMKTDINVNWDESSGWVTGRVTKHFDGEKYEIVLDQDNFDIDF